MQALPCVNSEVCATIQPLNLEKLIDNGYKTDHCKLLCARIVPAKCGKRGGSLLLEPQHEPSIGKDLRQAALASLNVYSSHCCFAFGNPTSRGIQDLNHSPPRVGVTLQNLCCLAAEQRRTHFYSADGRP